MYTKYMRTPTDAANKWLRCLTFKPYGKTLLQGCINSCQFGYPTLGVTVQRIC